MPHFILAAIFDLAPWMQFGLAGMCFVTLAFMVYKLIKRDNGAVDGAVVDKFLAEIEKRDIRLIEIQKDTINALNANTNVMQKVIDIALGDNNGKAKP